MFSSLKQQAVNFLEPYKQKDPATYAAAEQAIGGILIADGFLGTPHPFGGKKRPGIFGTLVGVVVGVVFMLLPIFIGNVSGVNKMTATTTATVVSVSAPQITTSTNANGARTTSSSCTVVATYVVNGTQYTQQSSAGSSSDCGLSQGDVITINYNPAEPGAWVSNAKTIKLVLDIFFWVGLIIVISSIWTFFVRLFSIIFGWKLLRDGRKNAANLPPGTNFQTMVDEIKQNFTSQVFGFGANATNPSPTNTPNNL